MWKTLFEAKKHGGSLKQRSLSLEFLEGRIAPAIGSFNASTGTLTFNYASTGSTVESVTLTNNGTTVLATGNVSGTTSFTTSAVKAVVITASGNSTAQTLTLAGSSAYSLSSGLSIAGIESLAVNAALNTVASDISMTLGNGVAINSPMSTTTGNITIIANTGAVSSIGNFYGIRASANVITAGGNIEFRGRGGTDSSGNKHGVIIDNGATVQTTGLGAISVTGTGGNSSGNNNCGVYLDGTVGAYIVTYGGNVIVNGLGGGTGSSQDSNGFFMYGKASVLADGNGTITITGTSGSGLGSYNNGVKIDGGSVARNAIVRSNGGDVTIVGTGNGSGEVGYTRGVWICNGGVVTALSKGTVSVTGTGGSGPANIGVFLDDLGASDYNSTFISSTNGKINISGIGTTKSGSGGIGVYFRGRVGIGAPETIPYFSLPNNSITISAVRGVGSPALWNENDLGSIWSGTSNIVIMIDRHELVGKTKVFSTGKISFEPSVGLSFLAPLSVSYLFDYFDINSDSGGLNALSGGISFGNQSNNSEIMLDSVLPVQGTVSVFSSFTTVSKAISSISGSILITSQQAISVTAPISTGLGNIILVANNENTASSGDFYGINISADLTAQGGNILLTGRGGDNSSGQKHGILVNSGASIKTGGLGAISLNGIGGNNSGSLNRGIFITGASKITTTGVGSITISGLGGAGFGNGNAGIWVDGGSIVSATGTGILLINAVGGSGSGDSNIALYLGGLATSFSSNGQYVAIDAESTIRNLAFQLADGAGISVVSGGEIRLTTDSFAITGASPGTLNAGSGLITIWNRTSQTLIDLGGVGNFSVIPLSIGLSDTELDCFTAAILSIGRNDSVPAGNITISSNITRSSKTNMILQTGGSILVSGGYVDTSGGNLSFSTPSNGSVQPSLPGTDVKAGVVSFVAGTHLGVAINNPVLNTGYQQFNTSGAIDLTGCKLHLEGMPTLTIGNVLTIVSAASVIGIFSDLPDLSIVTIGSYDLVVNYLASSVILTVVQVPIFSSANSYTTVYGSSGSYPVIVTAWPAVNAYSLLGTIPLGVSINASTGLISVSPTTAATGTYNFTIVASNALSLSGTQTFSLTVNKKSLTVIADNKSKTYDGLNFSNFTSTISGFVNGETNSVVSGSPGFSGAALNTTIAGTYTVTPTLNSLSASNYSFSFANGTLAINKATLTVRADDKQKTYDGQSFTAFTSTISGFVNGEDVAMVSGAAVIGGPAIINGAAGSYSIVPALGTLQATNYVFQFANGTFIVEKAMLTVTASNKSKTYDGQPLGLMTATVTGFVSGEDESVLWGVPAFGGTARVATGAGSYVITPEIGTLVADNYLFNFQNGLLVIRKATLQILAEPKAKTYDRQIFTGFTTAISGFVNSEDAAVLAGTVAFGGPATTAAGAGVYPLMVSAGSLAASNYAFLFVDGTLTINKAALRVQADNKQKAFNGQQFNAFTTTISGFVNGETASVISGAASFSGPALTATDRGVYSIVVGAGNLAAANYRFSPLVDGSLEIVRTIPIVSGPQTANFMVNQSLSLGNFNVSDPDSGTTGLLDITVRATQGKITVGTITAQTVSFAKKLSDVNQMLSGIKYTPALDAFGVDTITVTARDRDASGARLGSWTLNVSPATGVITKILDPGKTGKYSLVIQGSALADTIVVKPTVATSTTSYSVTMTGLGANAFSGITGRVLVYGLGGNDTLNVSTVKIATQLYGGDGHDILLGGAAGDLLYGGAGNDMILGGLGADILYGEAGNDILVDGNMALKLPLSDTLDKVLATWDSQPAPTIAIYNNITTRITPGFDRSAQDRLIGASGIDWFWSATAGALADITDIVAGEKRRVV